MFSSSMNCSLNSLSIASQTVLRQKTLIQVEVCELHEIYSNQEETDTRVVLYLHYAAALGILRYKSAVVRTTDTDVFAIILLHAHAIKFTVYLDTGSGKHRRLLKRRLLCHSFRILCPQHRRLHRCLQKEGEGGEEWKLEKNPRFHQLGDDWNVKSEVTRRLEQFICLLLYMDRVFSGRHPCQIAAKDTWGDDKLTSKSKVDLARLPPCYSTLKPHIQRVNHRVALYK